MINVEKLYPGREARKQKRRLLFFFCQGIVNILLCPAFLLLPFILQSFWAFLNAKVVCFFYSPSALPSQNTFCICLPILPLSLFFPFTLRFLIFYLPQVHQMIPLPQHPFLPSLPISAHIIGAVTWLKRGFKAGGSTFPVFHPPVNGERFSQLHGHTLHTETMKKKKKRAAQSIAVEPTHIEDIYTCEHRH